MQNETDQPAGVAVDRGVRPHSGDWMTVQEAEWLAHLWCAGQPLDDLPQWRTAMHVLVRELANARASVAAERERCAKVAEGLPAYTWVDGSDQWGDPCPAKIRTTSADYAAAIRGPNVEFSGVPAEHSSNHPAGDTSG